MTLDDINTQCCGHYKEGVPEVIWKVIMTGSQVGTRLVNSGKSGQDAGRGGNIVNPGKGHRDSENNSLVSSGNLG